MDDVGLQEFYNDQSIFLTGATGFLGKIIVEKLLRSCPNIKMLYLLIRGKKEKDSQQRINDLFNDPVFGKMKTENLDYKDKVTVISGDISLPDLGISESDRKIIIEQVTVVLHGAATVRFDERLKNAVEINVNGTKEILKLSSNIHNLKVFLYISTAYANCNKMEVEEIIYKPPIESEDLIKIVKHIPEDILQICCPLLCYNWPNTYAFTKQVTEDLVGSHCIKKRIPFAIFRPGIVIGAYNEPIPGWVDNIHGVTGVIAATGAGILRSMLVNCGLRAEVVPVDITVNAALTTAWDVACNHRNNANNDDIHRDDSPVYHCVTSKKNPLHWGEFLDYMTYYGFKTPPVKALCYYVGTVTKYMFIFHILNFLLHILPALIIDFFFLLTFRKPVALLIYRKVQKFLGVISYFSTKEWNFHDKKLYALRDKLSENDKKLFNFDMDSVDWPVYFENNIKGVRTFIFLDTPDTVPTARRRMFMFKIIFRIFQIIFFWMLYTIVRTPITQFTQWIVFQWYAVVESSSIREMHMNSSLSTDIKFSCTAH